MELHSAPAQSCAEGLLSAIVRAGGSRHVVAAATAAMLHSLHPRGAQHDERRQDLADELALRQRHSTKAMAQQMVANALEVKCKLSGSCRAARNISQHAFLGQGVEVLANALQHPQRAQRGGRQAQTGDEAVMQEEGEHTSDTEAIHTISGNVSEEASTPRAQRPTATGFRKEGGIEQSNEEVHNGELVNEARSNNNGFVVQTGQPKANRLREITPKGPLAATIEEPISTISTETDENKINDQLHKVVGHHTIEMKCLDNTTAEFAGSRLGVELAVAQCKRVFQEHQAERTTPAKEGTDVTRAQKKEHDNDIDLVDAEKDKEAAFLAGEQLSMHKDAIDKRIAEIELCMRMDSFTLKQEKDYLKEISELKRDHADVQDEFEDAVQL